MFKLQWSSLSLSIERQNETVQCVHCYCTTKDETVYCKSTAKDETVYCNCTAKYETVYCNCTAKDTAAIQIL